MQCAGLHSCRKAEAGVVAVPGTETETASGAERPGGRDQLVTRRLALRQIGF